MHYPHVSCSWPQDLTLLRRGDWSCMRQDLRWSSESLGGIIRLSFFWAENSRGKADLMIQWFLWSWRLSKRLGMRPPPWEPNPFAVLQEQDLQAAYIAMAGMRQGMPDPHVVIFLDVDGVLHATKSADQPLSGLGPRVSWISAEEIIGIWRVSQQIYGTQIQLPKEGSMQTLPSNSMRPVS